MLMSLHLFLGQLTRSITWLVAALVLLLDGSISMVTVFLRLAKNLMSQPAGHLSAVQLP